MISKECPKYHPSVLSTYAVSRKGQGPNVSHPPLVALLSRQSYDHTSGGASRGRVLPPASTVPSTKLHKLENPSTEKYLLSKERSDTRRAYYILEVHTGCKRPVHPPDSPDISPAESSEDPGPQVLPFNLDCTLHRNLMEPKYGAIV